MAASTRFTELKADEIANGVRDRKWKAVDVVHHFLAQARLAHEKTNCITQFLDEYAINKAELLDKELESGKEFTKDDYPFLGVPISIKDCIDINGFATTAGYKKYLTNIPDKSSSIVTLLEACGAIPFCKTNVCQLCLSIESSNPVYGTTLNPINGDYVAGGSSSGEGPLIKLKGSILGVGSDIGGSLRVPATFCGIYSMKPTTNRLPMDQKVALIPGLEAIQATVGPMANSVEDIELFMRSMLNKSSWKFAYRGVPLPYREIAPINNKKFKFGYFTTNGVFPATPAVQRAVDISVEKLRKLGYEVVPFTFQGIDRASLTFQALINMDEFVNLKSHLSDEGLDPTISGVITKAAAPQWAKMVFLFIVKYIFGQYGYAKFVENLIPRNAVGILKVQHQRQELEKEMYRQMDELEIDGIVCPVYTSPAYKHGNFENAVQGLYFSFLFNLFNMPSGVVPVTTVDPDLDRLDKDNLDEWLLSKRLPHIKYEGGIIGTSKDWNISTLYGIYDAKEMAGLPVGVQIAGRQYEDEKVIEMMKVLTNALKK